ncbi:MAG: energy-coupling factor ABC transporter permease [Neisseria sp.]|nr:energy-coupling factor ABC transporter permease [Neisseria sp.]
MNILADWFPAAFLYSGNIVLALLLAAAFRPTAHSIRRRPQAAGVVLCLFALLWTLRAVLGQGSMTGIGYHLLGISLGSLMVGRCAVLWLAASVMLPHMLLTGESGQLPAYGLNVLLTCLPALAVAGAAQAVCRRLPKNLFVYIFINGFFASALSMLAAGAAFTYLLSHSSAFADFPIWQHSFPVFFLLAWAEAFLSGLFAAVFVALKPRLLCNFDDAVYLRRQNHIWPSD